MTRTLTVLKSANVKTGPVALSTYRTQGSCPTDCALMGSGCYAENGIVTPFGHAGRGEEGLDRLASEFARLKPGDVIRLNVSGDYLLEDGTPDHAYIALTNTIPLGVLTISYTHAWRRMDPSWFKPHVRPNASCDTPSDLEAAVAAGWQTVIVDPGDLAGTTIAGKKVVPCVYETNGRQCIDCRLCGRERAATVSFSAHGTKKRHARESLMSRR